MFYGNIFYMSGDPQFLLMSYIHFQEFIKSETTNHTYYL